jgi:hypothetical protein
VLKATVSVDGASIRAVMAELNKIDPELRKTMRKELVTALSGVTSDIKASIPTVSPLSGMVTQGRLKWGTPKKPTVSITPGKSKRGVSFISIKAGANPEAAFMMGERAGSRKQYATGRSKPYKRNGHEVTHRLNGQGEAMVKALNVRYPMKGKGGRWAFDRFRKDRPEIMRKASKIVESYIELVNRKLS